MHRRRGGLRVHEEHRIAIRLAARLQPEGGPGRSIVGDRLAVLQERALAVLATDFEAGLCDTLGRPLSGSRLVRVTPLTSWNQAW